MRFYGLSYHSTSPLNPGESIKIPAGESAFLFFEPRIEEGFAGLTIDGRPNKDFKRVRIIYHETY